MMLTFRHDCLPQTELRPQGCPISDREVNMDTPSEYNRLNEFVVPDVRCRHTKNKLKLIALDGVPFDEYRN